MNLATLVYDLRALGVRKLSIELDDDAHGARTVPPGADLAETVETNDPPEEKLPTQCKAPGCGEERAGLFGGSVGGEYCRAHAAGRLGAKR